MPSLMYGRPDYYGRRIYAGEGYKGTKNAIILPEIEGHVAIDFYDAGVKTYSITSDMKDCPLVKLEFEKNENGCAGFSLELQRGHGIGILLGQRVDIRLLGDNAPWYSGYIQTMPRQALDTGKTQKYEGYGYFARLEHIIVDKVYEDIEIAKIAEDIIQRNVEGNGPNYNGSKLYFTGYTATKVCFAHASAKDALQQLSEFAVNYVWGVDEYRDVFFKPRREEVNDYVRLWIGEHVEGVETEEDIESVENEIYVEGNVEETDGEGNTTTTKGILAVCRDETSVQQYGLRSVVKTLPSALKPEDAEQWGSSELATSKDPSRSVSLSGIHPEIIRRRISPDGYASITSEDGQTVEEFPIIAVKYSCSKSGISMEIELGEYKPGFTQAILKMKRDIVNADLLSRAGGESGGD